jgi:hypothetical protein
MAEPVCAFLGSWSLAAEHPLEAGHAPLVHSRVVVSTAGKLKNTKRKFCVFQNKNYYTTQYSVLITMVVFEEAIGVGTATLTAYIINRGCPRQHPRNYY